MFSHFRTLRFYGARPFGKLVGNRVRIFPRIANVFLDDRRLATAANYSRARKLIAGHVAVCRRKVGGETQGTRRGPEQPGVRPRRLGALVAAAHAAFDARHQFHVHGRSGRAQHRHRQAAAARSHPVNAQPGGELAGRFPVFESLLMGGGGAVVVNETVKK